MYLVFNELSFLEHKNSNELLNNFIAMGEVFNKAKDIYGFTHLLFPNNLSVLQVTDNLNFGEWLGCLNTKERNKITAIAFRKPFLIDYLDDKKDETLKYYFSSSELNITEYCDGLATADVMEIPSISLTNHEIWKNKEINIFKQTTENEDDELVSVFNIATEEILVCNEVNNFCQSISTINLAPSNLSFSDKKQNIHLRDDHGRDVLQKFAEKIINNMYVEGVVNSLPFNPKKSRFIKETYKNGLIDIVLYWEDAGYGMVIKTTGRNYRETKKIAIILKNEFDK